MAVGTLALFAPAAWGNAFMAGLRLLQISSNLDRAHHGG